MSENILTWAAERGIAVLAMVMLYRVVTNELHEIRGILIEIRDKIK